ncbi:MAG: hypothetical protein HAW67_05160 [Endozoicomonadaceae bacterium]|nr:hypothetical protein [Endozoicomonadaceae bacterium]
MTKYEPLKSSVIYNDNTYELKQIGSWIESSMWDRIENIRPKIDDKDIAYGARYEMLINGIQVDKCSVWVIRKPSIKEGFYSVVNIGRFYEVNDRPMRSSFEKAKRDIMLNLSYSLKLLSIAVDTANGNKDKITSGSTILDVKGKPESLITN